MKLNDKLHKNYFTNRFNKLIRTFSELVIKMESEENIKRFEEEIPLNILNIFDQAGQSKFKSIYITNRDSGNDIENSLNLTTKIVMRNFASNKVFIMKAIEKELRTIKKNLIKKCNG